ncbi:FluG domain-containing protein, partial [Rostrohypoxylon terebratum]
DIVPDEVWDQLPPDPEITALEARRDQLRGGRYRYRGTEHEQEIRELTKLIQGKRAYRAKTIREEYRKYYFHNRPTWDIEKQANGQLAEQEEYVDPVVDLQIPERDQLARILCSQPRDLDSDKLMELRIQAADLMVTLCHKRETTRYKRIRQKEKAGVVEVESAPSPEAFPLLMQKTQCPRCIGDERLSYQERVFTYSRPAVMNDHFERQHLKNMQEGNDRISCHHPKCREEGVILTNVDHFRNHVQTVHGVWMRPTRPQR